MTHTPGDLRDALHRVADSTSPLAVDDDLWQRGHAARRRGRALAVAAVLAVVVSVGGVATLVTGATDPADRTASTEVGAGGAIPSRIVDPADPSDGSDLAVGRASVAFVGAGGDPLVVTATDGQYHALRLDGWDGGLVSLSPDGTRLVWTASKPERGLGTLDLTTGETVVRATVAGDGSFVTPEQVSWSADSQWFTWAVGTTVGRMPVRPGEVETFGAENDIVWTAIADDGAVTFADGFPYQWSVGGTPTSAGVDGDQLAWGGNPADRIHGAVASPTGRTFALATEDDLPAADFLSASRFEERQLPTDLYPDGAAVRPLGWATDTLVLAQVDGPGGSYVEGPHLALFTAPNTPEQQWTYRILAREVPDRAISVAVDLIPDLDGTSSQELTYDFPVPQERDISWLIGLGVAAAIAVLVGLRWLWRRFAG